MNFRENIWNRDLLEVIRQVKILFGGSRAVMFILFGFISFLISPLFRVSKIRSFFRLFVTENSLNK